MVSRSLVGRIGLSVLLVWGAQAYAAEPRIAASGYRGWNSLSLSNDFVELQVVGDVGGRVMQFKLGAKEFLWVNPSLAGKFPTKGLAADGGWFNAGGDKLWPVPQGWDNPEQRPGPPDPALDGQSYNVQQLPAKRGEAALRLVSGNDLQTGIQFSRVVRLFEGTTRVSFEATMKNTGTQPRRWGICAHTQLDAGPADGAGSNSLLQAWCPLNPKSRFPKGYSVILGPPDNSSFQPEPERGLMHVRYPFQAGKIGLDSPAGWIATVDGSSGAVFVQRFVYEPRNEYPGGASVEFCLDGAGRMRAGKKDIVTSPSPTGSPPAFASALLSPYARLMPGQSYTWQYDWYAANIGGDFPVVDCSNLGVVAEPLSAEWSSGQVCLKGRFGVFLPGRVRAEFADARGRRLQTRNLPLTASPLEPLVLDTTLAAPPRAASVKLILVRAIGTAAGELGQARRRQR